MNIHVEPTEGLEVANIAEGLLIAARRPPLRFPGLVAGERMML